MPAEAAQGVQRALDKDRFHLVTAEAEASEAQFTPLEPVNYPKGYPPLVVSPKMPYALGKDGTIRVHAQRVTLLRSLGGGVESVGAALPDMVLPGTPTSLVREAVVKALESSGIFVLAVLLYDPVLRVAFELGGLVSKPQSDEFEPGPRSEPVV